MKYRKQVNRGDKMRTQKYSNNLKENKEQDRQEINSNMADLKPNISRRKGK